MTVYYCQQCGFDSNNNPKVGIIFYPEEDINKETSKLNLRGFYHGIYYGDSPETIKEQTRLYHSTVANIMRRNIKWFCSIRCLLEFLGQTNKE